MHFSAACLIDGATALDQKKAGSLAPSVASWAKRSMEVPPCSFIGEGNCNNILGEFMGVKRDQLDSLSRKIFSLGAMEYFQKALAWRCYRAGGELVIQDTLYRHGCLVIRGRPRYTRSDETVLHAPYIVHALLTCEDLSNGDGHRVGRTRLSSESIVEIALPPSFGRERRNFFSV